MYLSGNRGALENILRELEWPQSFLSPISRFNRLVSGKRNQMTFTMMTHVYKMRFYGLIRIVWFYGVGSKQSFDKQNI